MEGKATLSLFEKKDYNNIINKHQPEPCLTDYIEVKEKTLVPIIETDKKSSGIM